MALYLSSFLQLHTRAHTHVGAYLLTHACANSFMSACESTWGQKASMRILRHRHRDNMHTLIWMSSCCWKWRLCKGFGYNDIKSDVTMRLIFQLCKINHVLTLEKYNPTLSVIKCKANVLSKPMCISVILAIRKDLWTCPGSAWHVKPFSSCQSCMKTSHSIWIILVLWLTDSTPAQYGLDTNTPRGTLKHI